MINKSIVELIDLIKAIDVNDINNNPQILTIINKANSLDMSALMGTENQSLIQINKEESPNDYILSDISNSAWIEINNMSVYLLKSEEGVSIEMLGLGHEADDPVASLYVSFNDMDQHIENLHTAHVESSTNQSLK